MSGKARPLEFWDARREQLLAAARSELAVNGVEGLTLDRVARRAGVSKGAVQYAFGSKEQLLGELAHDTLFGIFRDGVASVEGDTDDLPTLIDALSRGLASDEGRLMALVALMATARRSDAARDALANFYAETDPRIGDALRAAGVEAGDEEDFPALVRGVRGAILGMFVHWVAHPQGRTLDDVAGEVRIILSRLLGSGAPARAW